MLPLALLPNPFDLILGAVTHVLTNLVDTSRQDITDVLTRYLFTTVDTSVSWPRAITANPLLQRLNGGLGLAVDVLLTAVVLFSSLRAMFERSLHAKYSLKVMFPRILAAIVFAHGSLFFIQMFIDLNNALGHVALSLGDQIDVNALPWSTSISGETVGKLKISQDLFHVVFALAVVIALVILSLTYVIRTALLNVLIVLSPLAALCTALPDTVGYSRTWLRLFLVTVLMQAIQLFVLRIASVTALDHTSGLIQSLYGLATLYLMLKVPGALDTASHLETKAKTLSHGFERSLQKLVHPTHVKHRTAA